MKKFATICLSALCCSFSFAQNVITVEEDSGKTEVFDMPEGMLISEEDLLQDYNNQHNLTEGTAASRTLSYSDSILVSRLSRIPTTIEMPLNDVTRKFIDTYSTRMRSSVSIMLGAANFYNPIFEEALERYGLPLELRYLPVIESALRPSATSRAGAAGLWQFIITTGKRYGLEVNTLVDERRDPIKSSEAAAHYLHDLYEMFGDWGLAIAAYNCGEGGVQKAVLRAGKQDGADFWSVYHYLPRETRGYVPAFIAATYIMNYYCEHGIVPREATLPVESDTVVVQNDVTFAQVAGACQMSVDELRAINPQYRKDIVPANYALRLPTSAIEAFIQNEDSLYAGKNPVANGLRRTVIDDVDTAQPEQPAARSSRNSRSSARNSRSSRNSRRRQSSQTMTVRSGDTLYGIAKRYGTTVDKLRRQNGIKGDAIRPGQSIKVK